MTGAEDVYELPCGHCDDGRHGCEWCHGARVVRVRLTEDMIQRATDERHAQVEGQWNTKWLLAAALREGAA